MDIKDAEFQKVFGTEHLGFVLEQLASCAIRPVLVDMSMQTHSSQGPLCGYKVRYLCTRSAANAAVRVLEQDMRRQDKLTIRLYQGSCGSTCQVHKCQLASPGGDQHARSG